MTGRCGGRHTNQPHPWAQPPQTREELYDLIAIRSPSRGGGREVGRCLNWPTMNWWTMEFVVVDVGATLVLLGGYLALMIRKAVL